MARATHRERRSVDGCYPTWLACAVCGEVVVIWRRSGRRTGHVKTMYCHRCRRMTQHLERVRVRRDRSQVGDCG